MSQQDAKAAVVLGALSRAVVAERSGLSERRRRAVVHAAVDQQPLGGSHAAWRLLLVAKRIGIDGNRLRGRRGVELGALESRTRRRRRTLRRDGGACWR